MYNPEIMKQCFQTALFTSARDIGGPFGASVVKDGKIVEVASNSVLQSKDPTCHAEMNAIRRSCIRLGTHDLSGCELYATGYPCPMCLGAIMWAGIKTVYIAGTLEDAEKIGFKDKFIYETIDNLKEMCYNKDVLQFEFHDRELAQKLYSTYSENKKTIY